MKTLLIISLILLSPLSQASGKLTEVWKSQALGMEKKSRFFHHVKNFYLKNEALLSHQTEKVKTTFLFSLITEAYATSDLSCFYGGFPSKEIRTSGRLLCDRPHRNNSSYQSLARDYNCAGSSKYLCNPAFFGMGDEGKGICLPLKTSRDVKNITANCEGAFQNALSKAGGDLDKYLIEKLQAKEEPYHSQWLQSLEVLDEQRNCPTRLSWCRLIRKKVEDLTSFLSADLGTPSNEEALPPENIDLSSQSETTVPPAVVVTPPETTPEPVRTPETRSVPASNSERGLSGVNYSYPTPRPGSVVRTLEGYPNHIATEIKSPYRALMGGAGPTFFGYGFLHPESEFQAIEAVNFSCDESAMARNKDALCSELSPDDAAPTVELLINTIKPIFTDKLRNKVYEYLVLNLRAAGKNLGTRPECVSTENASLIASLPTKYPIDSSPLKNQESLISEEGKNLLNKFGIVGKGQGLETILRNVYMVAHLQKRISENAPRTGPFEEMAEERMNFIIQSSSAYRNASSEQIRGILSDVYSLLGDGDVSKGQKFFDDASLLSAQGFDGFADTLQRKILANQSKKEELTTKLSSIRENDLARSLSELGTLCSKSPEDLMQNYPEAVRQLMIDDPLSRESFQFYLCQESNFRNKIQTSQDIREAANCRLASSERTESPTHTTIKIGNKIIKVPKDSTAAIEVSMNLTVSLSSGLTEEQFAPLIQDWEESINKYYTSEVEGFSGRAKEELPRKLKFSIDLIPSNNGVISVSECVDSGMGKTCLEVIENNYRRCMSSPSRSPAEHQNSCQRLRDKRLADYRAGKVDKLPRRWNSGNFTPGITGKALVHEIGHHLGLEDEYAGGVCRSIATDDSLMSTGDHLQMRHFEDMVFKYSRCVE